MIIFSITVYVFVINLTVPPQYCIGPPNNKFLVTALISIMNSEAFKITSTIVPIARTLQLSTKRLLVDRRIVKSVFSGERAPVVCFDALATAPTATFALKILAKVKVEHSVVKCELFTYSHKSK